MNHVISNHHSPTRIWARLSDLNFNFTLASTLNYNFREFFKHKRLLNHIDFTGCGLGKQGKHIILEFESTRYNQSVDRYHGLG